MISSVTTSSWAARMMRRMRATRARPGKTIHSPTRRGETPFEWISAWPGELLLLLFGARPVNLGSGIKVHTHNLWVMNESFDARVRWLVYHTICAVVE